MKSFGLIGYPLGHSFSARYFSAKFKAEGLDCTYGLFAIEDESGLQHFLDTHTGLSGFNVTIPYKERIIPLLDTVSDDARDIGAVNVVKQATDSTGRLRRTGYNTDWLAFSESLKPLLTPSVSRALVLGTGGAAKAVGYALNRLGIKATFVSRTPETAGVGPAISYEELDELTMLDNTLIVNASPVGMYPEAEDCPQLPYQYLTPRHVCYDLVYNPACTKFMSLAQARGATVKNGMEMLERQAELSWRIWTSDQESV